MTYSSVKSSSSITTERSVFSGSNREVDNWFQGILSPDRNREARDWLHECLHKNIGIPEPLPYRDIEVAMRPLINQLGIRKHNRHVAEREWFIGLFVAFYYLSLYNDRENPATDAPSPDKEVSIPPREREPGQRTVEIARFQALKHIRVRSKGFISSNNISDEEKLEGLNEAKSLVDDLFEARLKGIATEDTLQQKVQSPQPKKAEIFHYQPKQEKALQPPDLSEIPLYRGHRGRRRQDSPPEVRPLDFLETHYGQWLSVFGAEENRVYQDQIRGHDRKLIEGVKNQLRAEGKGRKVSDIVKTRSARVDRELENVSVEDLKRKPQLAGTLYSREKRAADKAKAPSRSRSRNS
jgi:hypothetical protein